MSRRRLVMPALLGLAVQLPVPVTAVAATSYDDVRPLLERHCTVCHQGANAPLGLRLDSLAGVLAGSARGPVVKAGNAAGSELLRRLKGQSQPRMPLTGPPFLTDAEVGLFDAWIVGGLAPGAAGGTSPGQAAAGGSTPAESAGPAAMSSKTTPSTPSGLGTSSTSSTPGGTAGATPAGPPTWREVAPIFATRCSKCHSPQGLMGPAPEGVVLNSYDAVIVSTDRARVVPGRPEASELVRRIRGMSQPRMPFDGPPYLSDGEIALITAWIAAGARDSSGTTAPMPVGARIRLRGVMSPDGTLDGFELPPSSGHGGRRDRSPQPGSGVEVRGTVQSDGSIAIERLRGR